MISMVELILSAVMMIHFHPDLLSTVAADLLLPLPLPSLHMSPSAAPSGAVELGSVLTGHSPCLPVHAAERGVCRQYITEFIITGIRDKVCAYTL